MAFDEVTYSRDALDGVVTDLCKTLGLDRQRVLQIVINEGQVIAQVQVYIQGDPRHPSVELRSFEYEPPRDGALP